MAIQTGTAGGDVLLGTALADTLDGAGGNDKLEGSAGNDLLLGGDGHDTISGGAGVDTIDGGADLWGDYATFLGDASGVVVDLAAGTAVDGWGNRDVLIGIENVIGSNFNDTLVGNEGINYFQGTAGHDLIDGAGNWDILLLQPSSSPLYVDLAAGTSVSANLGNDTLRSIEIIAGGGYDDTLLGAEGYNEFWGNPGADLMDGRGGNDWLTGGSGNDTMIGGDGFDKAAYDYDLADYEITLGEVVTVRARVGDEGTDTLGGVERILFWDLGLAIDLDSTAGMAAKVLGVVFGADGFADPSPMPGSPSTMPKPAAPTRC